VGIVPKAVLLCKTPRLWSGGIRQDQLGNLALKHGLHRCKLDLPELRAVSHSETSGRRSVAD
jgi:hypothetical protein